MQFLRWDGRTAKKKSKNLAEKKSSHNKLKRRLWDIHFRLFDVCWDRREACSTFPLCMPLLYKCSAWLQLKKYSGLFYLFLTGSQQGLAGQLGVSNPKRVTALILFKETWGKQKGNNSPPPKCSRVRAPRSETSKISTGQMPEEQHGLSLSKMSEFRSSCEGTSGPEAWKSEEGVSLAPREGSGEGSIQEGSIQPGRTCSLAFSLGDELFRMQRILPEIKHFKAHWAGKSRQNL